MLLFYLMIVKGGYYSKKASALQERERDIAGIRGDIVDRNERIIATNETAYNISVIHNHIQCISALVYHAEFHHMWSQAQQHPDHLLLQSL